MHHYELQLNRVELQSHTGMHHYELQLNPVELQSHTGMHHYELQLNPVELQSHTGMHHYELQPNPVELQSHTGMHHYELQLEPRRAPVPHWHAPLRVHSAVQRHQSAERPISRQISSLMYPKIQRRQVIMNVLHPGCAWPPRWSPPVLWRRFQDGLDSNWHDINES